MLANPLNIDVFNSHPPKMLIFGLIIYMCLVPLNGLDSLDLKLMLYPNLAFGKYSIVPHMR